MVVTGLGSLSGPTVGADELWSALVAPAPARTFRELVGFEPRRWMERRHVQRTARFSQLAVVDGRLAHDDAGAPVDDPERVAVVMGTGNGGVADLIQGYLLQRPTTPEQVALLLGGVPTPLEPRVPAGVRS